MLITIIMFTSVAALFLSCCNIQINFWTLEHEPLEDRGHDLLRTYAFFISLSPVPGEVFSIDKTVYNITSHHATSHHIR